MRAPYGKFLSLSLWLLAACQTGSPVPAAPAGHWRVTLDPETGAPIAQEPDEPAEPTPGAQRPSTLVDEPSPEGGRMVRLHERFHMHSQVELDGSLPVQRCASEP